MTYFKKILAIAALFAIGAAHTKQVGKKATTPVPARINQPTQPQPKPLLQPKQPTQAKTFAQLYNEVKNARNVWDSKTQLLSESFINNLFNEAQVAAISREQFQFLLDLACDAHAQFTTSKKDIDILSDLNDQCFAAIDRFYKEL